MTGPGYLLRELAGRLPFITTDAWTQVLFSRTFILIRPSRLEEEVSLFSTHLRIGYRV